MQLDCAGLYLSLYNTGVGSDSAPWLSARSHVELVLCDSDWTDARNSLYRNGFPSRDGANPSKYCQSEDKFSNIACHN